MEDPLGRTRFMCGERFSYGAVGVGIRVHRWHTFGLEGPRFPNIARCYAEIQTRPGFHRWTADPTHHLEG